MSIRDYIRAKDFRALIAELQKNKNPDAAAVSDASQNKDDGSALFLAIEIAPLQYIEVLLENGYASIASQIRRADQQTPLELAIALGRIDVAALLLKYGALVKLTANGTKENSALLFAVKKGKFAFADYLLEKNSPDVLLNVLGGNEAARDRLIETIVRQTINGKEVSESAKIEFLHRFAKYLATNNAASNEDLAAYIVDLRFLEKKSDQTKMVSEALALGADYGAVEWRAFVNNVDVLRVLFAHAKKESSGMLMQKATPHEIILENALFENTNDPDVLNLLLDFYDDDQEEASNGFLIPSLIASELAFRSVPLLRTFMAHPKIVAINENSYASTGIPIWNMPDIIDLFRARHYVAFAEMLVFLPHSNKIDFIAILENNGLRKKDAPNSIFINFLFLSKANFNRENAVGNPERCIENLHDFFHAFTVDRSNDMQDLKLLEALISRFLSVIETFKSNAKKNLDSLVAQSGSETKKSQITNYNQFIGEASRISNLFALMQEAMNYTGATADDVANEEFEDRPAGVLAPLIYKRLLEAFALTRSSKQTQPPQRYEELSEPQHRFKLIELGLAPFDVCIDLESKRSNKKTAAVNSGLADAILEVVTAAYYLCPEIDYFAVDLKDLCRCLHEKFLPDQPLTTMQ